MAVTKRGPKKIWKTELLKNIVNRFFEESFVHGQVTPEIIAKFGREKMGYDEPNPKVTYQHFTRDKEVMDYINEINKNGLGINIDNQDGEIVYTEFKPDQIMKVYGNDMKRLMPILRQFGDAHRMLNDEKETLEMNEIKYKHEINELKSKYKKLDEKYKEHKELLDRKIDEVKRLSNFKMLADEITMRKYIAERTAHNGAVLNEDNIQLIINAMNSTGGKKSSREALGSEKDENWINNEEAIEDEDDDDDDDTSDTKVVSLKAKKIKKVEDEVKKRISELDDMI